MDVSSYRRVAERLERTDGVISNGAAAILMLHLCDEIERLQQHRCLWGNDPSGPHYSDEHLESLETLSDTVAASPMAATKPHVDEIVGWVDRFYGFAFDGWTHKDFTFRDDCIADFVVRFGNASPRRFVLVSKDAFATLDKISVYEKDDPTESPEVK